MLEPIKLMDVSIKNANIQVITEEIPKGISLIKAPELWNYNVTGKNVRIAVLDTGCDKNHSDLIGQIIGGRNFTADDNGDINNYMDYHGHGTHVAGIIAAKKNNKGIIGVAPDAKLLILKVLNARGIGTYSSIINAINYAVIQKVNIISMSLGGPQNYRPLHQAIQRAVRMGITVVCAAANNGDGRPETSEYAYPAYYPEVISVGAAQDNTRAAFFSNSNNQIDLIAPGVNILSTLPKEKYGVLSGTSMAAPHVTGALALIGEKARNTYGRQLTEIEMYAQLVKNTVSIGLPKVIEGNGILYLTAQEELAVMVKDKIEIFKTIEEL